MRKLYWIVASLLVLLVISCGLLAVQPSGGMRLRFVPWGVEWVRQSMHDGGQTICEESTRLTVSEVVLFGEGWCMRRADEGLPEGEIPVWVPPE